MVGSLGKRFVNQSDLFTVAKNSAANPDLSSSLEIMMKAALAHGASAVRFVLPGDGDEKGFIEHRFGRGKHAHFFAPLDREILNHTQTHGETVLGDFQVGQTFNFVKGMPYPASLIALPLAIENKNLGVFYVTYQDKREVDQEEVRYFKGLAQKSSQVIAHASHLEKISQLKDQYGKALDLVIDGVLLTDKDQTVIYANAACEKIFGLPTQSLIGEGVEKFMGKGMLEKISQKKADGSGIEEILLSDHRVYAVWHNRLHLNEKDDTKLFTLRDITAQKQRDAIKSEYVTTVSHELRSPLTLIQGYAKILRLTGNLHEQQNEYVNNIIDGVEDMKILVQNLLDIGRLEGGDPLDIAQVDAVELAQKAINSMAALAKQKNIELRMEAPQESLMIEADAQFLSLGLKNLLDNAIKYTKLRGEVTLSITEESDNVIFTVRDNGIGVSPLDQRHLFEKFNRVVTLQGEKQQGSGLGLAIVKSIAEHHGGKVWLESQLGKGSSFYLSIPKAGNSFQKSMDVA
jgi:PAS domain S-box-containing protein